MRSLLFMPCYPPPPILPTFAAALSAPPRSLLQSLDVPSGLTALLYSPVGLLAIGALMVYMAREVAILLMPYFGGLSGGVITVLLSVMLLEMYRRTGVQCTLWAWLQIFMVVLQVTTLMPRDVPLQTATGTALKTSDPLYDCRRLATCRALPVYSNHKRQVAKVEKCEECLAQGAGFTDPDGDGEYECDAAVKPPDVPCAAGGQGSGGGACAATRDALEIMGRDDDVASTCAASGGRLCHVAPTGDGVYVGYAGEVDLVSGSSGLGYPTASMCEEEHPGATCVEIPGCVASDKVSGASGSNCYCDQFKSVSQYDDPCDFLSSRCDTKSVAYQEAKLQLAQSKVSVDDVVSVDDLSAVVDAVDRALNL